MIPTHTADKYTWSKPSGGAPFANYDPTLSSNQFSPFVVPSNFTTTSISCYFAKPADPATVTCVFHSGALGIDIPIPGEVKIAPPLRSESDAACGTMQLRPNSTYPTDYVLWGKSLTRWDPVTQQNVIDPTGMYAVDNLTDPSPLSGGKFAYLQLVSVDNKTNGVPQVKSGLDGGFPYGSVFDANTMHKGHMDDVPGGTVHTDPFGFSYEKNGVYTAHLMYKPTD
ncbi:hypothetical protein EON82_26560, partial [bacterium]